MHKTNELTYKPTDVCIKLVSMDNTERTMYNIHSPNAYAKKVFAEEENVVSAHVINYRTKKLIKIIHRNGYIENPPKIEEDDDLPF